MGGIFRRSGWPASSTGLEVGQDGTRGVHRGRGKRVWAGMVNGDWEGEEEVKEVKEKNPPPKPRPKHHHPHAHPPKVVARKSPKCILSRMTHQMEPRHPQKRKPPPSAPRPQRPPPPPKLWGGVPTTPSSAPRSTSCTLRAWRWTPCAVSTGERRGCLGGIPTQPPTLRGCPRPALPLPEATHENHVRVRKPSAKTTPPPHPSGQHNPKTNTLISEKTSPRLTPRQTTRLTPNEKTVRTLSQPPTQHSNCGTPRMGQKKCENTSHSDR